MVQRNKKQGLGKHGWLKIWGRDLGMTFQPCPIPSFFACPMWYRIQKGSALLYLSQHPLCSPGVMRLPGWAILGLHTQNRSTTCESSKSVSASRFDPTLHLTRGLTYRNTLAARPDLKSELRASASPPARALRPRRRRRPLSARLRRAWSPRRAGQHGSG